MNMQERKKTSGFILKKLGTLVLSEHALVLGEKKYGWSGFNKSINGQAFQQDALATHKGYQYVGYYDGDRHVCIARRKLSEENFDVIKFDDYFFKSNDGHNSISLGICPNDGTIHLAFDHHVNLLHYRVSKKMVATNPEMFKWDLNLFSPITSELEKGKQIKITYPRFWKTPKGGLQFCWRRGKSGRGDRMMADYDPDTGLWKNSRQIDSRRGIYEFEGMKSSSRNSYPNGYEYGPKGKLHVTWVWRESSKGTNHDLMYCYSEDGGNTWCNNEGQLIKGPPNVNTSGLKVVDIGLSNCLMNTQAQAVDSTGKIHVVMWHCTEESVNDDHLNEEKDISLSDEEILNKYGLIRGISIIKERKNNENSSHKIPKNAMNFTTNWGNEESRRYHHYWRDDDGIWQHTELPGIAGNRPKLLFDKKNNAYLIFGRQDSIGELGTKIYFSRGYLVIMAASPESEWTDWQEIHTEKGPFLNEMLFDFYRWKEEEVLSILVQNSPKEKEPTQLSIIDFKIKTLD